MAYNPDPNGTGIVYSTTADSPDAADGALRRLAQNLGNDPVRMYEWVRNNIRTEFYLGGARGAYLTFIDRAGNDVDQCSLLGALFRAAGYTPSYRLDWLWVPRTASGANTVGAYDWLGVTDDESAVRVASAYSPDAQFDAQGNLVLVQMWVSLDLPGRGETRFVPSVKPHQVGRRPNLDSLSGYMWNDAALAAGSGSTGNSSPALNTTNLRTYLTARATQASGAIRSSATLHNLSGAELARVPIIVPEVVTVTAPSVNRYPQGLLYNISGPALTGIPQSYCSWIRVKVGSTEKWFESTSLFGWPLAVEFDGNGDGILRHNGAEVARDASGAAGTSVQIELTYEYAYAFFASQTDEQRRRTGIQTITRQDAVAVVYSFGRTVDRLRKLTEDIASREAASASNVTSTDRLQIIGHQYVSQMHELALIGLASLEYDYRRQFSGGFVYLRGGNPVVDWPLNQSWYYARSNSAPDSKAVFAAGALLTGALEGTAIEQSSSGRAFGTPSLIDYAMTLGQGGAVYVTSTAQLNSAGLSNFNDTTLGNGAVANIQAHLNAGGHVLVLANSNVSYNNLSYGGYLRIYPDYGGVATILKGAKGGGGSAPPKQTPVIETQKPLQDPKATTTDPVDLGNGAFLKDDVDLVVGSQSEPNGLRLARNYNGMRRSSDPAGLGRGFTHSYVMRMVLRSPNDLDSARASVDEVLPVLIAMRHAQDSINYEPQAARSWLLGCSSLTWAVNQQIGTRAAVTLGSGSMEFVRRPDGSYTAPGNVTATLTKQSDGKHLLSFRHGNTIRFLASDTSASSGKFDQIVDPFGRTLTANYNTSGQLWTVTDSYSRTLTFSYTGGQLTSVTDGARTVSYLQDSVGLTVTDPEGKTTVCEIDGNRRLTAVTDGRGRTIVRNYYDDWHRVYKQHILGNTTHENKVWIAPGLGAEVDPTGKAVWTYFDLRGRKIFVVDQAGKLAQWHYDGADRLTDMATPEGRVTSYEYDANHNLTKETNPAGHSRTIEYDSALRPWKVGNFEGQITEFGYNAQHKVTSITAPGGIVSTFEYHTSGNGKGQLAKAHPAAYESGKFDYYTYDIYGNPKWIERGVATSSSSGGNAPTVAGTYDAFVANARGDVTESIDRRGVKTTFGYNNRRQRTTITQWEGTVDGQGHFTAPYTQAGTSTTAYDDAGDVDYVLDASGRKTDTEHNALGDVTEVRSGDAQTVVLTNTYNTRNLLETATVPYDGADRTTTYEYYDTQTLKSVKNPLNKTTTFGYDNDLRRTSITTPLGFVSSTVWDSRSFKDGETDAESRTADYSYDRDGRSATLANRLNNAFSWTYDDASRKVTTKTPLQKTTISILNTRGLPESVTEPSLQATTFDNYDAEGRLKKKTDGVGETNYTYFANGLLHTVAEGGKTTTRTYDALNRLQSYQDGEGNTIAYTYWPSGELKTLTYPGNKTVTYTYDDFGRLWKVTDWNNKTTTYTYWENGLLRKVERPNGTVREQSYDAAGQLRYVRETKAGVFFAFQELRYDADGRIEYSFLHPMPAPITLPSDNMLFDADNRLSSFNGDAGVTYDEDGNLTRGPGLNGVVPATANFTYDSRNRLTSHGGSSYRYNPDGLRVEVTGTGACTYVIDPNAALSRTLTRTKNGVTTYYIYGVGLLYECDASGNSARYYHADQVGSIVALTDTSGTITDRWSYSPFGTEFRGQGTTDTPFRFNGEFGVMTEASGLVYMRARYYNPRLMCFLNADPIGFGGGINWYSFAGNNPISRVDPDGQTPLTAAIGAGIGFAVSFGVSYFTSSGTVSDRLQAAAISGLGGAIQGAWIGSGAGFVTAVAARGATAMAVRSAGLSLTGSAVSNASQQVITNVAAGKSLAQSVASINTKQVQTSAAVGAAFGAGAGALAKASESIAASAAGIQATMRADLTTRSAELISQGATGQQTQAVQQAIMAGMARMGASLGYYNMAYTLFDEVGLEIAQEVTNNAATSGGKK